MEKPEGAQMSFVDYVIRELQAGNVNYRWLGQVDAIEKDAEGKSVKRSAGGGRFWRWTLSNKPHYGFFRVRYELTLERRGQFVPLTKDERLRLKIALADFEANWQKEREAERERLRWWP